MYSWQLCHPHLMVALLQAVRGAVPRAVFEAAAATSRSWTR